VSVTVMRPRRVLKTCVATDCPLYRSRASMSQQALPNSFWLDHHKRITITPFYKKLLKRAKTLRRVARQVLFPPPAHCRDAVRN
jgi:hypothetical protein